MTNEEFVNLVREAADRNHTEQESALEVLTTDLAYVEALARIANDMSDEVIALSLEGVWPSSDRLISTEEVD